MKSVPARPACRPFQTWYQPAEATPVPATGHRERYGLRRRGLKAAALVLGGLALAACSSVYRSPGAAGLPADQRASLQIHGNQMDLVLTRLDGREVDRAAGTRVELAPGDHVIAVNVASASSEPLILEFTAEAGRRYSLNGSIVDRSGSDVFRWLAEITETGSSRVISRRPGDETAALWATR